MYTYFTLWDLRQDPFKIEFGTYDAISNLEIRIGEDMEGKTHTIWCDNLKVHIGIQDIKESKFSE